MPEVHLFNSERSWVRQVGLGASLLGLACARVAGASLARSVALAALSGGAAHYVAGRRLKSQIRAEASRPLRVPPVEMAHFSVPRPEGVGLHSLPLAVWGQNIFCYLKRRDVERLSRTSKHFHTMVTSAPFAKAWYKRCFGLVQRERNLGDWWARCCAIRRMQRPRINRKKGQMLVFLDGFGIPRCRGEGTGDRDQRPVKFGGYDLAVRAYVEELVGDYRVVSEGNIGSFDSFVARAEHVRLVLKRGHRILNVFEQYNVGNVHFKEEPFRSLLGWVDVGIVGRALLRDRSEGLPIHALSSRQLLRFVARRRETSAFNLSFKREWAGDLELAGPHEPEYGFIVRQLAVELLLRSEENRLYLSPVGPDSINLSIVKRPVSRGVTAIWEREWKWESDVDSDDDLGPGGAWTDPTPFLAPDGRRWEDVIAERPILHGEGILVPRSFCRPD